MLFFCGELDEFFAGVASLFVGIELDVEAIEDGGHGIMFGECCDFVSDGEGCAFVFVCVGLHVRSGLAGESDVIDLQAQGVAFVLGGECKRRIPGACFVWFESVVSDFLGHGFPFPGLPDAVFGAFSGDLLGVEQGGME